MGKVAKALQKHYRQQQFSNDHSGKIFIDQSEGVEIIFPNRSTFPNRLIKICFLLFPLCIGLVAMPRLFHLQKEKDLDFPNLPPTSAGPVPETYNEGHIDISDLSLKPEGQIGPYASRKKALYEETLVFLTRWKNAWQKSAGPDGDLQEYLSCYSEDFITAGKSKNDWQQDKSRKNSRKSWIRVDFQDISVHQQDDGLIRVQFEQEYQSSNFSENSSKIMVLSRENGQLKIVSEQG